MTALNDRYPEPFVGLDFKTGRSIVNQAFYITEHDEPTEADLWEARPMPRLPRCHRHSLDLIFDSRRHE